MTTQRYHGHTVEGFASAITDNTWEAAGRVVCAGEVIVQSGKLGCFRTRERALADALAWGKAWVDVRLGEVPRPAATAHWPIGSQ